MTTMLRNNLYAQRVNIVSQASETLVDVRVDHAEALSGQKGKAEGTADAKDSPGTVGPG